MKIKLIGKPEDAPYLTPGKVYEVSEVRGPCASIVDDEGEVIQALLPGSPYPCAHARPAKWEVVE